MVGMRVQFCYFQWFAMLSIAEHVCQMMVTSVRKQVRTPISNRNSFIHILNTRETWIYHSIVRIGNKEPRYFFFELELLTDIIMTFSKTGNSFTSFRMWWWLCASRRWKLLQWAIKSFSLHQMNYQYSTRLHKYKWYWLMDH